MSRSIYQRITNRILDYLEQGTVPWRKPWKGGEQGHPKNLFRHRPYRGINTFLLTCAPYESPYWLTYKQTKKLGGHVLKGEKSTPVIFWKWVEKEDDETGEVEKFPLLRYYNVFNVEQCELPERKVPELSRPSENNFEPIEKCEQVVKGMPQPPSIQHVGGAALYRPSSDTVCVPKPERFEGPEEYYSTLFHELTHSTGHETRLNRPGVAEATRFGTRQYSKEELVAEMSAAFLCGHCGIENKTIPNSASYISGWLRKLRNDKRLVVLAAAAAQKAADYILAKKYETDPEAELEQTNA